MDERSILKIAHIADVHFRGLSRHDEYVSAFENLIDDARRRRIDIFFIAGDIWHTKTSGMTGEFLKTFSSILVKMSEIAPVHMMLGNHDMNCANLERVDAISPIVEMLANPRIVLHRTTSIYPLNERTNLCVFSLVDREKWAEVEPEVGKYNIACFHGVVGGARTPSGWKLHNELTVGDFSRFDVVMLGDVHKMQFLDVREHELEIDEDELGNYPDAVVLGDV